MAGPEQGAYTFIPWFRQGVAAGITQTDDPANTTAIGRATLDAQLTLTSTPLQGTTPIQSQIDQTVQIIGPGDISSLKTQAILRVFPPADARDATPGELAYVEFYDEDLPWRYTPAKPATVTVAVIDRPQLRPWLALFVLAQGEFAVHPRAGGVPELVITATTPLPPPDEAWAWAHAQLAGSNQTAATAGAAVAADPDAALSRLMSPRKLVPGTSYTAFVVPAFETGRLAGLGEKIASVPALQPSWSPGGTQLVFPIYYAWQFTTGTVGTFESYVRRLSALRADDTFGKRAVAADLSASGLDATQFDIEGALRPPEFVRTAFPDVPGPELVSDLTSLLDQAVSRLEPGGTADNDPGVVPPVYGRWHAGALRLAPIDPDGEIGWVREVNLDLRERASAGLGAQVVRDKQDELIARAWAQVASLHDVNQRLREAELAVAASSALFQKHFVPVSEDELFMLSAAAHHGLAANTVTPSVSILATGPVQSLRAAVAASLVPTSIEDGAFKCVTRPAVPLLREATQSRVVAGFRVDLVTNLNDGHVTAAPPLPPPAASVSIATVSGAAASAAATIVPKATEPKRLFWQLLVLALTPPPATVPTAAALSGLTNDQFTAWKAAPGNSIDAVSAKSVTDLIGAITAAAREIDGSVTVTITAAEFTRSFGPAIAGKGGDGVTIMSSAPAAAIEIARFADLDGAADYGQSLSDMAQAIATRIDAGPPPPPIAVGGLLGALVPADTLADRVTSTLPGFAADAAERAANGKRRLQPVQAYPTFPDPMITALQSIDREYVLPNMGALPEDTLTLMEPNGRFLESYFAGLNTQMARELLWQEYPTDQRGSYFRVFWARDDAIDAHDATDIAEMANWTAELGDNGSAADQPLVLVIRSELLRKFPNTVVYAQAATFDGVVRTLDLTATPVYPSFHASLDPDVFLIGFALTEDQARGSATDPGMAGMYFVLAERPGQVRFGLDDTSPPGGLKTWDDLSWATLQESTTYIQLGPNKPAPTQPSPGVWDTTSADLAAILFRSPTMYARHASNMLPPIPRPATGGTGGTGGTG